MAPAAPGKPLSPPLSTPATHPAASRQSPTFRSRTAPGAALDDLPPPSSSAPAGCAPPAGLIRSTPPVWISGTGPEVPEAARPAPHRASAPQPASSSRPVSRLPVSAAPMPLPPELLRPAPNTYADARIAGRSTGAAAPHHQSTTATPRCHDPTARPDRSPECRDSPSTSGAPSHAPA